MNLKIKKHKVWWIVPGAVIVLAILGYINRARIEKAIVAISIYRAHVFTPPLPAPELSRWGRLKEHAQFYWDFAEFRLARERRLKQLDTTLRPLVKEIGRRQKAGQSMQYSMHIYREIRWWLNFTPNMSMTRDRISDLRSSLTEPAEQKLATEQQPSDGSWGLGFSVWFLKLYYSVDHANPKYPMSFLDQVNSPEKLKMKLDSDLYDNFTKTGVFNREELDETFSALARLLFGPAQTSYAFHPQLKDALSQFVAQWQNPATGCWGQWLIDRHGEIWKMDDVGMTFHVVSDLNGQVPHLDRIAKRVMQLDGVDFPAGIRFNGHYENHLNWDAVKIFRNAWASIDNETRQQVRTEIHQMLDWCLTKSYQPDGSFKVSDLDETVGDAYFYGVSFLQELGYFQSKDRFWTDLDFPNSKAVHDRIESKLKSIGLNDPKLKEAYEVLNTSPSILLNPPK